MAFEFDMVKLTTWVEDVRPAGLKSRVDAIVSVLKDMRLDRGRIGAELGAEQYMGLSFLEFEALKTALPRADFADAAEIILTLRATKSPQEVAYISKAGRIVSAAMEETFDAVRAGMTEIEVATILRTLFAEKGAETSNFMWVVSSKAGMIGTATERKLRSGELLVLDCGVAYHGYGSDVSRSACIGEPPDDMAEFYTWMTALTRHCVKQLRVGQSPSDVAAACRVMCDERGLVGGISGRIGHGVGLESTEYPSMIASEEIVFEPGMVFALNPNFFHPVHGWMNNEDNWVITEDGPPELLSGPIGPENLFVVKP